MPLSTEQLRVVRKKKDGEYPDVETWRQEEWAALVLVQAQLYLDKGEHDRALELIYMWDQRLTIKLGLPIRTALYEGGITNEEYLDQMTAAYHSVNGSLIMLRVTDGIPLEVVRKVIEECRAAQEAIVAAPSVLTKAEGDALCVSDNLFVGKLYEAMVEEFKERNWKST